MRKEKAVDDGEEKAVERAAMRLLYLLFYFLLFFPSSRGPSARRLLISAFPTRLKVHVNTHKYTPPYVIHPDHSHGCLNQHPSHTMVFILYLLLREQGRNKSLFKTYPLKYNILTTTTTRQTLDMNFDLPQYTLQAKLLIPLRHGEKSLSKL